MKRGSSTHAVIAAGLLLATLAMPALGKSDPNDPNRYLNAVREFADNVLKYGRDTYGPKQTPLFVDGLNIHTHEPVKWIAPNGNRWILSNLASQQNLFRTLDGLTRITGDPKYKQAAMDAIKYAFANLRTPNGLLYWGGHSAYDLEAERPCGRGVHEFKSHYPYYELMWQVDPNATKHFIGAFWSGHIRDWSNLDMDRHCYQMSQPLATPWKHEYKGGSAFSDSKTAGPGVSFLCSGSDLFSGAALLAKLSGDGEPLMWANRLVHRYVETRDPNTGLAAYIYTGKRTMTPTLEELKHDGLRELSYASCFPYSPTFGDSDRRRLGYGYCTVSPGIPFNLAVSPWICALLVGDLVGSDGREFVQWSVEELTARGKVAYRVTDNSWIPMLRNGTSLEGMVLKQAGPFGPEGTVVKPIRAIPMDFWAYALAYRLTGNGSLWQMARNIALGNGFGDIGATSNDTAELKNSLDCADPFGLMGFLELYRKTQHKAFLGAAKQIGNNILTDRFHKGFFVPSRYIYTRFDSPEPIALLHLHAASVPARIEAPTMWPSLAFFEEAYRDKDPDTDTRLIYTLTNSSEPPLSLQEAAARGDIEVVRSLIAGGSRVDEREDGFFKTALHRAAMSGHADVVRLLLAKGAQVDAGNEFPRGTPLDCAAEKGHKEVAELLIAHSADVNAARGYPAGDRPLHSAIRAGHKDIVELLISKGADVNAKNDAGQTPLGLARRQNRKDIVALLAAKLAETSIHGAAGAGDLQRVKTFLEQGTDINAKDENGQTPLHAAAGNKQKDVAEFLISKGADLNAKDGKGYTPLYSAIWGNDVNMVGLFVSKGADINFTPEKDYPPLHYAVWFENLDMARVLVDHGAGFDVTDRDGWTAFRYAAWQGNRDIVGLFIARGADVSSLPLAACAGKLARVKELVEQGADINGKDKLGWTPLYWAASMGRTEVAKFLIDKGADVRTAAADGATALHQAAQAGDRALTDLMLSKGADVKAKTKRGNTPLHSAASAGHREVAELLLAKGAEINAKTTADRTPLHNAVLGNHKAVVELLIKAGADASMKDRQGRTPLAWAEQRGYAEIAELLRKHGSDSGESGQESDKGAPLASTHDIAVTNVSVSSSCTQGDTVAIAITVANQGNCRESFDAKLSHMTDGNEIGIQSVTLSAKDQGEKDADVIFTGQTGGKQSFGDWLAVGDVNGDGYDDVLVSAAAYNDGQGRAYLYYGGRDMDDKADRIFTGENIGDAFSDGGGYLADMNNDGFDDVIIGARYYKNHGRVYLFIGGPNMDEEADIIFEPEEGVMDSSFGRGMAVGDLNGDGYKDLIVSAPCFNDFQGRAYLFFGGHPMDNVADKVFTGEVNTKGTFGAVRSARGDIDGDGCDDLLIGTRYYPEYPNNQRGRAYLFYGGRGTTMAEACDLRFDSATEGDEFASSVDLFDVDRDGYADVIIGARKWNHDQGRVYLYWGSDRTTMDNKPDLHFDGEIDAKADFGSGSVMVGFANKDKYGDIVVPAFAYYRGSQQGRAYLYYGNTRAAMDTICDHTFTPNGTNNQPQRACIGDFNGDGWGDIILGGYQYNNYQGRCWLWYGGPESSTDVTFNWDTIHASTGQHTVKAEVGPVAGETDTADNAMTATVDIKKPSK